MKLFKTNKFETVTYCRMQFNFDLPSEYYFETRNTFCGICPIATSTTNKRNVPIIVAGCMAHEREGYISTSGLKSDVTIVIIDPDFH